MSVQKRLKASSGHASEVMTADSALALKKDIAGLLVRNYKSSEIAKELGISHNKVASYIEAIREEWGILTSSTFKEFQAQELVKLEQIEREAWIAWERSKKKHVKSRKTYIRSKSDSDDIVVVLDDSTLNLDSEVIEETQDSGDAKYLDVVMKAMAHRAKILGIDKVNVNVFSANISINQEQPEYQQRVDQFLAQFGGDYRRIIDASFDRDRVDESVDTEAEYTVSEASIVPDED